MMFRDESNDLPGPRLPFLSLSREEGRPHVHVQGSNGEAKFWLAQNYGSPAAKNGAGRLMRRALDPLRRKL